MRAAGGRRSPIGTRAWPFAFDRDAKRADLPPAERKRRRRVPLLVVVRFAWREVLSGRGAWVYSS